MRYDTKVVIDMETGIMLERISVPYDGPWELLKPSRSPLEGQAQSIQQQDQSTQQQDYGTAQGTLGQFEGPVQQSPYYKSLVATGTDATSNAYQNAQAATRAQANQAGFGYEQPVTQGAESAVGAQEASKLAQIPAQSAAAASPLALQAAGQTAGMGTAAGQQGLGYFGDATSLEEQYQNLNQAFLNKLAGVGGSALSSAFPGSAYGPLAQTWSTS